MFHVKSRLDWAQSSPDKKAWFTPPKLASIPEGDDGVQGSFALSLLENVLARKGKELNSDQASTIEERTPEEQTVFKADLDCFLDKKLPLGSLLKNT